MVRVRAGGEVESESDSDVMEEPEPAAAAAAGGKESWPRRIDSGVWTRAGELRLLIKADDDAAAAAIRFAIRQGRAAATLARWNVSTSRVLAGSAAGEGSRGEEEEEDNDGDDDGDDVTQVAEESEFESVLRMLLTPVATAPAVDDEAGADAALAPGVAAAIAAEAAAAAFADDVDLRPLLLRAVGDRFNTGRRAAAGGGSVDKGWAGRPLFEPQLAEELAAEIGGRAALAADVLDHYDRVVLGDAGSGAGVNKASARARRPSQQAAAEGLDGKRAREALKLPGAQVLTSAFSFFYLHGTRD